MADAEQRVSSGRAYYDRFAEEVAARSAQRNYSRAMTSFTALLDPDAAILDMGCGAGEHMLRFRQLGFRTVGVEPSAQMRALADAKGLHVVDGSFETLRALSLPDVSGIWCAASLLHVPTGELKGVLEALHDRLPTLGPLFVSVRLGSGGDWDRWDGEGEEEARFIQLFSEDELQDTLRKCAFSIVESWTKDSDIGKPSRWISVVARAR